MKKRLKNIDLMIYNFILIILLAGISFYILTFLFQELKSVISKKPVANQTIHFDIEGAKKLNLVK